MKLCSDLCEMLGISTLIIPHVEADDTIASIALWASGQVFVLSQDKDLFQIVSDKIHMINIHKNNAIITPQAVREKLGVSPSQVVDYLSLVGDSADNIPGIPGVGPKTAAKWLQEYTDLDGIIQNKESLSKKQTMSESTKRLETNRKLIRLQTDVSFPKEESFFKRKAPDVEALRSFYKKMEFSSFLKELKPPEERAAVKTDYRLIDTEKKLSDLVEQLAGKELLCINVEMESFDIIEGRIVGLGISADEGFAYYIPWNGPLDPAKITPLVKPLLESKKVCGHNIKFDYLALQRENIELKKIHFDTMLASYLCFAHSHRHSLDDLTMEFCDFKKTEIQTLIGKGKKQISMASVPIQEVSDYCCEAVDYTYRLYKLLAEKLQIRGLVDLLHKVEIPFINVLAAMEKNGIYLDIAPLQILQKQVTEKLALLEKNIYELAGETFNIKSTKQLGVILYEKLGLQPTKKTKTSYSTSVDVLLEMAKKEPIARHLIEYRKFEKLRSTYIEALPLYIHKTTNRIHPNFVQAGTATGRLACQNPNLQNIPIRTKEGLEIRAAFKPQKKDWLFLAADYSQIELRVTAHLSKDPNLIKAFQMGEDIHRHTAALVYDIPPEKVSQKQRSFAKAINFGIIYGQSPYGLAKILQIEPAEAKEFIENYFQRYPLVKKFLDDTILQTEKEGLSRTLIGRERLIAEINSSNTMVRQAAQRLAINTPVQGGAADIMKLAMLDIQKKLREEKMRAFLILQIHDELIFELPEEEASHLQILVKESMENAYSLSIPLTVNISIGKNWKEC